MNAIVAAQILATVRGKAEQAVDQLGGAYLGFHISAEKMPLLLLLVGLVLSFVLVRVNTRLIRKGVPWWPGNFESGDLHIHHVVFGVGAMIIAGILEFALTPVGWTQNILGLVFGGGMGIALDEFALVLHLKDVYWSSQGRRSIDAVVIVATFILMLVIGLVPLSSRAEAGTSRWALLAYIVVHAGFVILSLVKGKLWTGVIGIFIPIVAWVGAVRLARPSSPWAHRRYKDPSPKLERARLRAARSERRWGRFRDKAFDAIGGFNVIRPKADRGDAATAVSAPAGGDGGGASSPVPMPKSEPADGAS